MQSFRQRFPWPRFQDGPAILLVAGIHVVVSEFAYLYTSLPDAKVTPIWPSAGVTLAALFLFGPRVWPGIFIGDFLLKLVSGLTPALSFSGAIANTTARLVAYAIARRHLDRNSHFQSLTEVWTLLAAAAGQAAVSALIGVTGNCWFGTTPWSRFFPVWLTWWSSNATSTILFFPIVLFWAKQAPRSLTMSWRRWLELLSIGMMIVMVATLAFGTQESRPVSSLVIPIFVWLSLRFNSTWVATGIILISLFSLIGTANGLGQFSGIGQNGALILLQAYTSSIAVMSFSLVAVISQARNSQSYLRQILDHLPVGVAVHNPTGWLTYLNLAGKAILRTEVNSSLENIPAAFHVYKTGEDELISVDQLPIAKALKGELNHSEDIELRWSDRTTPLEIWGIPIVNDSGQVTEGISLFQDIRERQENARLIQESNERLRQTIGELAATNHKLEQEASERQQAQAQLWHLAHFDPLTQLPNRAYFIQQLHIWFDRYQRERIPFALLFLDCDRFKIVNDSLGHNAGDELLVQIARRLESCLCSTVIFSRLGGDEFGLLAPAQDPSYPQYLAHSLQNLISQSFEIQGQRVYIGASIGIDFISPKVRSAEELLRNADTAMYAAKRSPLNRGIQVFTTQLSSSSLEDLALETALHEAIKQEEIQLYYQPIIDIKTGHLLGAEALARWFHPQLGSVPPLQFITLAEKSKTIFSLGNLILNQACQQIQSWQEQHLITPNNFVLHVNVSAQQICHEDFGDWIRESLQRTAIAPCSLMLEITETTVADMSQTMLRLLQELQAMGIRLSIDDFGTGYSSLSYLQKLPVNSLKIDRTFIKQINEAGENRQVAQATIALAHSFGLEVVAEGIEDESQLYWLRQMECDMGQGYYFAKPLSVADMTEFLRCHPITVQSRSDTGV